MFRAITDWARWLDQWLETNLGRPYNAVLSVGLVLEMINKIETLPANIAHGKGLVGILFSLVVEAALLINQLGEFSHRRHKRKAQKAAATGGPSSEGHELAAPRFERPEPISLPPSLLRLADRVRRRFRDRD
ncbi:hypothetical protein [Phenylobacterium sp.]|uniref:hypothetical protein n=1 Tax=Phenylobacterium sp. TaxID=1871053 RepID=UPI00374D1728